MTLPPQMRSLFAPLLRHLPQGALAFDASVIFGGFSLQLLTQIGWLIMAVRFLGPEGYGLFASLTAITVAVSCFVGWGCDQMLIRAVAADRTKLQGWLGHSLIAITGTALAMGTVCFAVLAVLDIGAIGTGPLLAVLMADLLLARYANLCIAVYMATGEATRQSTVTVLIGACRLVAIALAAAMPGELPLAEWAWWYAGSSAVAAGLCLGLAVHDHGLPRWTWVAGLTGDGFAFSAESALQASIKDLDKPIIAAILGPAAAGLYAAAFRIIDTLSLPIRALGYAIYPRLFRMAAEGREACVELALRLLPLGVGVGLAGAAGVLIFAGLLPWIFGAAYEELPWLTRLLTPMPALFAAYVVGADALSAIGRQSVRLLVVVASLGMTLLLCWFGAEQAGVAGAAIARILVAAATVALVWALILLPRRQRLEA
ncbi:MAG TPA: lipopolysaccharide biosynthesis protein [Roseomonas sp.]